MNANATAAIENYAQALRVYCRCPDSLRFAPSPSETSVVRTEHGPEAFLLPVTRRPIRGLADVSVDVKQIRNTQQDNVVALGPALSEAIPFSASPPSAT